MSGPRNRDPPPLANNLIPDSGPVAIAFDSSTLNVSFCNNNNNNNNNPGIFICLVEPNVQCESPFKLCFTNSLTYLITC